MKEKILEIIQKEKFNPGIIGFFINYNYLIRRRLYKNNAHFAKRIHGDVLDFGCGVSPYKKLFSENATSYKGVDYFFEDRESISQHVDKFYDGKRIPYGDDVFDCIVCTEVLEHVFNIDELLLEFRRVLKPNGIVYTTTPFVWEEHEVPFDFARYTPYALSHIYKRNGFEVLEHKKSGNFLLVIFQLKIKYIKSVLPKNWLIQSFLLIPVSFAITLFGEIFNLILPKSDILYFNNVFLLRNVKD